ncbi:hypothetical protein [Clostridium sp. CCUG 7971]|uniref:hypothetical protein n=1 Tax=Clostridium sp. CCUG 7971 TaxID=2811414 RepID=UPI001ABAB37B|nr:hypothetical protein [Clostridium sp. CCUG 7971]MBO3445290.1 hypothetical protein [Clostridium sp. CCUG 7971]
MSYRKDDYGMNYVKEDVEQSFFKKNIKVIIAIIVAFSLGAIGGSSIGIDEKEHEEVKSQLENKSKELETANSKISELETKVQEAKPYFDMSSAEQEAMKIEAAKKEEENKKEQERIAEEQRLAELEERTKTLKNGNFIAGKDFDPGTYDIVAIAGGGNVTGGSIFKGGINAIMGPADDGFYQKEYKNIAFKEGESLKVSNVTIKLIPAE